MLLWQILAVILFSGFVLLAVLAFIEPGPLNRRSRTRQGTRPAEDDGNRPGQEP